MNRYQFYATIERYHTFQNPTSEEKLDLAIDYCGVKEGMRILDVGCGKGWLMRRIAKRFDVQITGLEINRMLAADARRLAADDNLSDRIEIVEGAALDYQEEPADYDIVMCIGASFALGGFEPALDWMNRRVKLGGVVAIGEVFAKALPLPSDLPAHRQCEPRSLWATAEKLRSKGLQPRGIVESSIDDWNRYHSLHWKAAVDWVTEHPDSPDAEMLLNSEGQRCDVEVDGRMIGWAIIVTQNGVHAIPASRTAP